MRYEVYTDAGGSARWRLKSSNGQVVAVSGESFASTSNATRAARRFRDNCRNWAYSTPQASNGNYFWRAKATNGEQVAWSGEWFASKSNAQRAADNVRLNGGNGTGV